MLSAHGSAPEVVAAARANGGYVVDAVCPLVTKVHHEVKVRAGKGYQIVYVGHEGHEEAVGTMAVAPDAIHRVETRGRGRRPPRLRRSRSPCSPRPRCQPPRLGRRARRRRASASPSMWMPGRSDLCFATTNRQSALLADRRPLRRRRRDRLGQLVEHPGPRASWPARPGCARVLRVNGADELPDDLARHRRRHRRRVGPRGAGRRGHRPPRAPPTASRRSRITDEDEYFPPPRNLRDLLAAIDVVATRHARRLAAPTARVPTTARCRPATSSPPWPEAALQRP